MRCLRIGAVFGQPHDDFGVLALRSRHEWCDSIACSFVDVSTKLFDEAADDVLMPPRNCSEQSRKALLSRLVDVSSELLHEAAHSMLMPRLGSDDQGRAAIDRLADIGTQFLHQ
jgi:hypothetical protein